MARKPGPSSEKSAPKKSPPKRGPLGSESPIAESPSRLPTVDSAAPPPPAATKRPPGKRRTNSPVVMQRRGSEVGRKGPATPLPAAKPKAKAAAKARSKVATEEGAAEGAAESGEEALNAAALAAALPTVGSGEEASHDFLLTYFKDLTRLSLLTPAAEYELARRIGIMEEVLWVQALSFAPLTAHLRSILEQDVGKLLPEFKLLQQLGHALVGAGKLRSKELADAAGPVAAKLRALDLDRLFVTSVLEEVKELDGKLKSGERLESLPGLGTAGPAWQIYVQGISVIAQLIQRAKEDFVKANLRLVVSIARRFNYGRMPLADLIQEGNVGLIKAVERFDYRRGFRFSTYAAWWIRHAISRGLADKGRVVRLPIHTLAEHHAAMRARRKLTRDLGRAPTHQELADATGLKLEKIEKMDSALLEDAISLDREVSDGDNRSFMDFLQDEDAPMSISERLISEAMLSEVQELLGSLSPMETDILRLRFGLDSDQELTLKEIGDKYGLSRERIRQIQEGALSRMRRALARKDLI